MPPVVKTLREFLLGALTDFADSVGFADLASPGNLASLIVSLAHYQEEGRRLLPEVFLCRSIDEVTKMLPGSERIQIGAHANGPAAIEDALKRCAPLATQGWCVYVEKPQQGFQFGLFRGSLNPIAISVERTLFTDTTPTIPLVHLHRFANGCVALRNQHGDVYQLMLSEKSGLQLVEPANASVRLVAAACKKVAENDRESVKTCLERILRLALIESHGSLIAVSASDRLPSFLSDGVSLKPPLDLQESVRERLSGMASDDYRIEGVTSLIRGMLRSDGITVFSPRAKVLAYNCFIRVRQRTTETIVGGARSRAYAALAAKLGTGIIAVFSQSQDGWTKFEEVLL